MFRRGDDDRHEPIQPKEVGMAEAGRHGRSAGSAGGSEVTVVGQGARIDGTLVSAGSLRIDGHVQGKVRAEGDVTLSPQSNVQADIDAQNVTVAGAFKGNINAKNRAELASGGRVDGNITAKVLVVAEGAVFSGQSIMGDAAAGAGAAQGKSSARASEAQAAQAAQSEPVAAGS